MALSIPQDTYQLDHIGHAVSSLQTSVTFYTQVLGFRLESEETLNDQRVELAFLRSGTTLLELLSPLPGNEVLSKFLARRGPSLHHICFRVPNIYDELQRLQSSGIELIDKTPRPGSRGTKIAFLHPRSTHGLLIELCS